LHGTISEGIVRALLTLICEGNVCIPPHNSRGFCEGIAREEYGSSKGIARDFPVATL